MKIAVENIGKVGSANIEINSITVIAGPNNTGKSTFGKALYAVFNSYFDVVTKIEEEKSLSIRRHVSYLLRDSSRAGIPYEEFDRFINISDYESVKQILLDLTKTHEIPDVVEDDINSVAARIIQIQNVSPLQYEQSIVLKKLVGEFGDQICNIYTKKPGRISLTIRNQRVDLFLEDDSLVRIDGSFSLGTEAIYIDDPFVLDRLSDSIRFRNRRFSNHQNDLFVRLRDGNERNNIIDEILKSDKLSYILDRLSSVDDGIVIDDKYGFVYKKNNHEEPLNLRNISSGLKTFVILKRLLLSGTIEYNGTLILDEPEIHLHPEWQLVFAELIVLIQKEFQLHILLNTHSPYFLRALELYSKVHGTSSTYKYYLSTESEEFASIEDVTNCTNRIYEKLLTPFQTLEDIEVDNE